MAIEEFKIEPLGAPVFRPHIRWPDGYRVVKLGVEGRTLALPGEDERLEPNRIRQQHNILIFGERSGGIRDFLRWLMEVLKDDDWVLVGGAEWAADFFQWSNTLALDGLPDERRKAAEEAIDNLGSGKDAMGRAEALMKWAEALQRPFTLIVRDLTSLGDQPSLEVATAFRMVMERKERCPELRILVTDTSESVYMDRPDRSGYRTLAVQYRLPSLVREEIEKLAKWSSAGLSGWTREQAWNPLSLNDEALDCLIAHTGGQPLLVQRMLKGLQRLDNTALERRHVEKEARALRLSPPDQTRFWQKDLRRLLKQEPALVTTMKAYLLGKSLGPARFPPPSAERALCIAGWVKIDPDDRWGIASQFHAHLARGVLQELDR